MNLEFNLNIKNEGGNTPSSILNGVTIDSSEIENITQSILEKTFSSKNKRKIDKHSKGISFACPYCGDSERKSNKKRANIYFNSNGFFSYHCFNCKAHVSVYRFFKDFIGSTSLTEEELRLYSNIQSFNFELTDSSFNLFDKDLLDKTLIPRDVILDRLCYYEVTDFPQVEKYLKGRYQTKFDKFAYSKKHNSLIIFNSDKENKVFGYTIRTLDNKNGSRYYLYKLSKIYEQLKMEITEDVKLIDKYSTIFNLLSINYNQPVTIFEGPLDSFLYKNSIALTGATKQLPIDIENVQWFFDNDQTGREASIEMIRQGKTVFLWKKIMKDLSLEAKSIKDLNELYQFVNNNKIKLPKLQDYFSNKILDMYYV